MADLLDRLGRTMRQLEFDGGLNPAQWEALRYLSRANRISRTPGAFAEYLGTTRGTASQTLICLQNKGYVRKVACQTDRRVTYLELTPEGAAALERDPLRRIDTMLAAMPNDMEYALREGLGRLLGRLAEDEECRAFGVCIRCTHLETEGSETAQARRCGLTGEPLSESDTACICADFQCAKSASA